MSIYLSQRISSSCHSHLRKYSLHYIPRMIKRRIVVSSSFNYNNKMLIHTNTATMNQTYFQLPQQQHKRHFSDNLLGYSPMAPQNKIKQNMKKMSPEEKQQQQQQQSSQEAGGPIIGVDSNTTGGGVWSQTSAKRTKLGELKMELKFDLGQRSLDDVATEEEKYDLFLIDGIHAIVNRVDCGTGAGGEVLQLQQHVDSHEHNHQVWSQLQCIMKEFKDSITVDKRGNDNHIVNNEESIEINKEQFDQLLSTLLQYITEQREKHPAAPNDYVPSLHQTDTNNNSTPPPALLHIRDFLLYTPPNPDEPIPSTISNEMYTPISKPFILCLEYFQIILLQSALEYLMTQWDNLTLLSSGDQDRAAVHGDTTNAASADTLNLSKLYDVVNAFGSGSCSDRVQTLWKLLDRDNDSMLDQEEMDRVVYMSIVPMEDALKKFTTDTTDVWPMRKFGLPPPCLEQLHDGDSITNQKTSWKNLGFYKRWKQQRLEKQAKRTLLKLLDGTVKNHFEVEVETPHRLRCIYAWADKNHQDGKIESVLVDATNNANETGPGGFFSGAKKRYVELDPKISYSEFREEQVEHFPHLDRVGQELCTSLKEDLWVHQGKGREKQQLKKEIAAFLAVLKH